MVLLQCVNANEAEQILLKVHEGSFGTYANRHAMARKILSWVLLDHHGE